MKKKILIGAFALVSLLGGTFAYETFSGQKEAEALCVNGDTNNGICISGDAGVNCYPISDSYGNCSTSLSGKVHQF